MTSVWYSRKTKGADAGGCAPPTSTDRGRFTFWLALGILSASWMVAPGATFIAACCLLAFLLAFFWHKGRDRVRSR